MMNHPLRPEQTTYANQIESALASRKDAIVIAEGGTGVGKTRVALGAAIKHLAFGEKRRVVIAVPQIKHVHQFMAEWAAVFAPDHASIRISAMIGRAQFVDPDAIDKLFALGYTDDAVLAWRQAGGKPAPGSPGATLDPRHGIAWLREDLERVATDFPVEDAILRRGTKAPDHPYEQMRAKAYDAQIVVCTHALLAHTAQAGYSYGGSTCVSDRTLLIIDEAHAVESAYSSAATHSGSIEAIHRLTQRLHEQVKPASRKLKTLVDATALLLMSLKQCEEESVALDDLTADTASSDQTPILSALRGMDAALTEAWPMIEINAEAQGIPSLHTRAKSMLQIFELLSRNTHWCHMTFSPIRKFPTLLAGPRFVDHLLRNTWRSAPQVLLTSATLVSRDKTGAITSSHVQSNLAIPRTRVVVTAPVTAKWAYSRPSVYLPDSKSLPSLWPPKRNALPEDVHAWHCNVAAVLLQQAETAVGGMLSLSTSFATVQRLRELLYPNLGERLIWQRDGYSANRCAKDFVDLYRAGIKPVWLGTGGAWTGLDLRDLTVPLERAHEDNLLTDLNINRIPFGVNRSLTHQHRKETFGFACEKTEVEFIFRQGMGRLVRSDGVNDRRLAICDARLRLPAYAAVCSGVLLELKRYKQIHALSTLADSYEAKAA